MIKNSNKISSISTSKVIIAVVLSIVILAISQMLSFLFGNLAVGIGLPIAIGNLIAGILYPLLTFLSVSLLIRRVLKFSLEDFKIKKFYIKPVWLLTAFIMPLLVSVILLCTKGHWEHISISQSDKWAILVGGIVFLGISTGIVEEIIFRGVIMSALEHRWNKQIAIIVPSILFGIIHIIGRNLDFLSIVQLIIAGSVVGILFSLVTYESGSIWSSALIHGVWNAIMIGGILNIGSQVNETSIFNYILDIKSFFITGGEFGVEASMISVLVYLIFIVLALRLLKKNNK